MARKKVKISDLKQLDVISAIQGSDHVVAEIEEEKEPEKKEYNPWSYVNDIRRFKRGDMLDDSEGEKNFNSYQIMLFLAAKLNDVYILNYFNKVSGSLSKQQLYTALVALLPKDKGMHPYVASKKEKYKDSAETVARYFECSEKEATEFIDILGEEWALKIKEQFGEI